MTLPETAGFRATPRKRLAFIEGLRALCALYVVLGHIAGLVDPSRAAQKSSQAPGWMQLLFRPFQEGHLAVAIFIVISGFCLAHSAFQRDPNVADFGGFFRRRAERILPAYYLCLALSIVVALNVTPIGMRQSPMLGMPFAQYLPVTWQTVWAHVFMVHNLRADWMYKLNGVLWSIAIEFQLYFAFPLLMRLLTRWGWLTTIAAGSLLAALITFCLPNGIKLYGWFVPLFTLGALGARWATKKYLRPEFMVIGVLCAVAGFYATTVEGWNVWISDCLMGFAALALLSFGAHRSAKVRKSVPLLNSKPLVLIGSFSYSLYLIHHPILQVLYVHRPSFAVSQVASFWYLLFFGFPVVVFCAFGFGLLCEGKWVRAALDHISR